MVLYHPIFKVGLLKYDARKNNEAQSSSVESRVGQTESGLPLADRPLYSSYVVKQSFVFTEYNELLNRHNNFNLEWGSH